MFRLKHFASILIVFSFFCIAEAHEDPIGEIYPVVSIEDNKFIIYYTVTKPDDGNRNRQYYQMVFDKAGRQLGPPTSLPRDRLKSYRLWSSCNIDVGLPQRIVGFVIKQGEEYLVTPRIGSEAPYFLSKKSGKFIKRAIEWGDSDVAVIQNALVTKDHVIVLLTEMNAQKNFPESDAKVAHIRREE